MKTRALAKVREAGGEALVERLEHLDRTWAERGEPRPPLRGPAAPGPADAVDCDVAIAGGGLWSLVAPLCAKRGLSVTVLDRAKAGQAHREWNASGPELEALVDVGLLDRDTLGEMVVARYDYGTCRFAGGGDYPVRNVLDHAVDAGALLAHARSSAERAGVRILDGHTVTAHAASPCGVRVRATSGAGEVELTCRVLVDARGASSPFASADLVCPTVGGVLHGLAQGGAPDEVDPRVGEILATVDGVEAGRQHVWEAFPGRSGETTVYLFYYAKSTEKVSLAELYARFFDTLPYYKRGDARLVRPTFGFIPGWSRLTPAPDAGSDRIVLVGDAAARHSPLTYCGFGATLRSLGRAADAIVARAGGARSNGPAVDDAPVHALTGALAHLLAARAFRGGELNELLDAAFRTLYEMGETPYGALLRDTMRVPEFVTFLRRTAARHPAVWGQVMRGLGVRASGRWGLGLARSMLRGRGERDARAD